ncbi:aldehyde dehydrogenase, dimeric NADP-preferring-like [Octopus vulgaris]|uniref:Aldehyde dehydrogenase n=3 Tax=Octopus TaxID=6643 RepID=A0AA36AQC6_OCTVU|nr:aldehyde dehydrogenase, dimeric NADP-preferring-like [Octopus vulgaris]
MMNNTNMAATEQVFNLRRSFQSGITKHIDWRHKQLKAMLLMFEENRILFVEALKNDLYKDPFESLLMEIDFICNEIIYTLNNFESWVSPVKVSKDFPNLADDCFIKKEPFGVILVIAPWNYPIQLLFSPLIGILAAGNCAMLKPSEFAPQTSQLIETLIPRYMDTECICVYPGGTEELTDLLDQRFDHIFFAGSSSFGRAVMAAASKFLTPVTLQLSSKCPVYVDENCNLEVVAQRIIWGKLINVGQNCVAPDYVICNFEIQDLLFERMQMAIQKFYGNEINGSEFYGKIANEQQYQRLKNLLMRQQPTYGGRVDDTQQLITPGLIINAKPGDPFMEEEIFGPILPIVPVRSADEAIDLINSYEKPLALYLFSKDKRLIQQFLTETSSGGVCINDTVVHTALNTLPFGGVGHSGMGYYHGKFSFDNFSHHKSVMWKSMALESVNSIRYPPYNERNYRRLQWVLRKSLKRGH